MFITCEKIKGCCCGRAFFLRILNWRRERGSRDLPMML